MTFESPGARIDRDDVLSAIRAIVEHPMRLRPNIATDKDGLLDRVAVAAATVDMARQCLEDTVCEARDGGVSWVEVGHVLGISRQAAFQRFGPT